MASETAEIDPPVDTSDAGAGTTEPASASATAAPAPPVEAPVDITQLPTDIDKLLFKYCELLDAYQSAQALLAQSFTTGFLRLAEANYGSRMRYGRDYYHGNMSAAKVIDVKEQALTSESDGVDEATITFAKLSLADVPLPPSEDDVAEAKKKAEPVAEPTVVDGATETVTTATETPATAPRRRRQEKAESVKPVEKQEEDRAPEPAPEQAAVPEAPSAPAVRKPKIPLNRNPIRWFGVLVPHTLRESQAMFQQAAEQVAVVVSLQHELTALGDYIADIRQQASAS
ncbi:uncharacterized protein V1518DRAFT_419842 [Limtongia smithiae]|uniref:uncharacterized protein n=1 Tax=Limtongia smithiae TaxID=1125753 RepID=UPI0034CD30C4